MHPVTDLGDSSRREVGHHHGRPNGHRVQDLRQHAHPALDRHDAERRGPDRCIDVWDETDGPDERIEPDSGDVPTRDLDLAANPGLSQSRSENVIHEIEGLSIRPITKAPKEEKDGVPAGTDRGPSIFWPGDRVNLADVNGHRDHVNLRWLESHLRIRRSVP